jgi:hypothetical protein
VVVVVVISQTNQEMPAARVEVAEVMVLWVLWVNMGLPAGELSLRTMLARLTELRISAISISAVVEEEEETTSIREILQPMDPGVQA